MKVERWTAIELLDGPERQQYKQLRELVLRFQLSLDYRQWRRSDWLEKGSSYALLRKAYDLLDTYECRCRMFALSFMYDPNFQRYIAEDRSYLRNAQTEEVLYLLRIHADEQPLPYNQPSTTTETINFGFRKEPTRFSRFTEMVSQLLKEKGCTTITESQLRQFCRGLWQRIVETSGSHLRQERQQEVGNELLRSLKYERMRMELVRELMQQDKEKSRGDLTGYDFRGSFLREVISKKHLKQLEQAFGRFNNQLYEKEKLRERFAEEP